MLDDPPHMIDLINYVMFITPFHSVWPYMDNNVPIKGHGGIPPSLMVLYLPDNSTLYLTTSDQKLVPKRILLKIRSVSTINSVVQISVSVYIGCG